jgi:ubiquinone/menaquinone biosynthesis C-methylase UbiE
MSNHDVDRFNAQAARYDASWLQHVFTPVHKATLEFAAELNPRPREVLDVGCGTGALLRRAAGRFPAAELVGVDIADQMIEQARTREPRARFLCASAARLPFDDNSFRLVVSTLSFGFWPHPAGLAEIRRVLAPGGHVVLADLFGVGWLRRLRRAVGDRYPMFTAGETEQLLTTAGLVGPRWKPVLRAGPVPLFWAVAAGKPSYQPPVQPTVTPPAQRRRFR